VSLRQLEAFVGLQLGAEFGPSAGDLHVEAMQVNGEKLGVEDVHEAIDGGVESLGIEFFR